jgi:hypothetical protein
MFLGLVWGDFNCDLLGFEKSFARRVHFLSHIRDKGKQFRNR